MGKDAVQTPKKGTAVKNGKQSGASKKEAAQRSADFLDSLDKEIAALQAKKELALKAKSSVAATKGKRKVKSVYASIPPNLSELSSSDSGKADDEFQSSDDGEVASTSKKDKEKQNTTDEESPLSSPPRGRERKR